MDPGPPSVEHLMLYFLVWRAAALPIALTALSIEFWPARWLPGLLTDFIRKEDIASVADVKPRPPPSRWRRGGLIAVALLAVAYDIGTDVIAFRGLHQSPEALLALIVLTVKAIISPPRTAPIGLIVLALLGILQSLFVIWDAIDGNSKVARLTILLFSGKVIVDSALFAIGGSYYERDYSVGENVATSKDPSTNLLSGPEDNCSFFSAASMSWVAPLIKAGGRKSLAEQDIWLLSPFLRARVIFDRFRKVEGRSLLIRLLKANSRDLFITCSLTIVVSILEYVPPYLLNQVLKARIDTSSKARWQAFSFVLLGFIAALVKAQLNLSILMSGRRGATRIWQELVTLIHDKALRRRDMVGVVRKRGKDGINDAEEMSNNTDDIDTASAGKVVNLMQTDTGDIADMTVTIYMFFQLPTEIALASWLLYRLLGWSAFAGLCTFVVVIPLQRYLVRRGMKINEISKNRQDKRVDRVTELITCIRFFKSYGWENRMAENVDGVREEEIRWLVKGFINDAMIFALWICAPPLVIMGSFAIYTQVAGHALDIATGFTAMAIFAMLSSPLNALPVQIGWLLRAMVSVRRIDAFLKEPEVEAWACELKRDKTELLIVDNCVAFEQASFRWHRSSKVDDVLGSETERAQAEGDHFTLRDLDIVFPSGQLTLIVGPVGSGKSSLLSALLGEMTCISGKVMLNKRQGRCAYASQQPWLEHASIRDNILFSEPFDTKRYNAVIDACCLGPDLKQFADGDQTEIGERGISLSGGQKARVALARAVYSRAAVLLADNPLSAVDAPTAAHIYEKCLRGPLCANRTLLLVTHHVALCQDAAAVILRMADGRIESVTRASSQESLPSIELDDVKVEGSESPTASPVTTVANKVRFIEDEEVATGNVQSQTFRLYIQSMGWLVAFVVVLAVASEKGAHFVTDLTLKWWGESGQAAVSVSVNIISLLWPTSIPDSEEQATSWYWLTRYFLAYCVYIVFAIASYGGVAYGSIQASRNIFSRCLHSVIRSPNRFFDKTPTGRITNRFSKDIDTVDQQAAQMLHYMLTETFELIATLLILMIIVPSLVPVAIAIIMSYYYLSSDYIKTTRDLRRLAAAARSPLYSAFGELLVGLPLIRAFSAESRYEARCHERADTYVRAEWYYWMANRFILYRFDLMGALFLFSASTVAIYSNASQGFVAIVLVSSAKMQETAYWVSRFIAYVQTEFNAVERIQEYIDLPSEGAFEIVEKAPPAWWPSDSGGLEINDICVRYGSTMPLVLKHISLNFRPREKIGIVGRSGSGKTTLTMALLRLVELDSGSIVLDGLDISTLGLRDVRERAFTIIAQDATLWSGDLRSNLDPFSDYSDTEIWDVLRRVQLVGARVVEGSASPTASQQRINSLQFEVGEGGGNLSAGQRQLCSLARALLRRPKVILLDEASSVLDSELDTLIQRVIREELRNSLVITIAHRLRTIIDCDRVAVFDQGQVTQFDTPSNLLKSESGAFHELCKQSADYQELKMALQ